MSVVVVPSGSSTLMFIRTVPVTERTVLPELLAVVRQEDDQRVVVQTAVSELVLEFNNRHGRVLDIASILNLPKSLVRRLFVIGAIE